MPGQRTGRRQVTIPASAPRCPSVQRRPERQPTRPERTSARTASHSVLRTAPRPRGIGSWAGSPPCRPCSPSTGRTRRLPIGAPAARPGGPGMRNPAEHRRLQGARRDRRRRRPVAGGGPRRNKPVGRRGRRRDPASRGRPNRAPSRTGDRRGDRRKATSFAATSPDRRPVRQQRGRPEPRKSAGPWGRRTLIYMENKGFIT
jgi:hypothetical protein